MPAPITDWAVCRQQMLARYRVLLAENNSPLLGASQMVQDQLAAQFFGVVDEAVSKDNIHTGGGLSSRIGQDRASTGVHPSQSLDAANLIFAAALNGVADRLALDGTADPIQAAALRLNRVILRRMGIAASGYVEHLLERAATAHRDEARRLSRQLHDAVGPNIAVGLQRLDLIDFYLDSDPEKARALVVSGQTALREAVSMVRSLAAETRAVIEPGSLADALADYLDTFSGIATSVQAQADLAILSVHAANEVFLVLREAIRNAATHGDPSRITVVFRSSRSNLIGTVTDDGVGFDPASVERGTGSSSMSERAALLNAQLTIRSEPGNTTVTLDVPLPRQED